MELPPLGSETPNKNSRIVVRYFAGALNDPNDCATAEDIMTKSVLSENTLTRVGDIAVFKEDTTFDKQGNAHILIKYGELCLTQ